MVVVFVIVTRGSDEVQQIVALNTPQSPFLICDLEYNTNVCLGVVVVVICISSNYIQTGSCEFVPNFFSLILLVSGGR